MSGISCPVRLNLFPKLLFTVLILVLVSSVVVSAQQEYTSGSWIDAGYFRDQLAQHSPKIACSTDNPDLCVVLSYFSGDSYGSNALVVKWSFDGMQTFPYYSLVPQTVDYETSGLVDNVTEGYTEMGLPYDITYYNSQFWVIFDSGSTGLDYVYTFDPSSIVWTLQYTKPATVGFLNIMYNTNDEPLIFTVRHNDVSDAGFQENMYMINGTVDSGYGGLGNFDCYLGGSNYIDLRGFADLAGSGIFGSGLMFDFVAKIKCSATSWHTDTGLSQTQELNGLSANYTGLWYWDGAKLFYTISNQTTREGSVRYVQTTDLTSFGTDYLYYDFNESIDQFINYTDYDGSNGRSSYVYKQETNETGRSFPFEYSRGLFASQVPMNHLRIFYPSARNLDTGVTEYINLTAVLSCDDYIDVQTGYVESNVVDFYTTCNNNTLSLINTSYEPVSFSFPVVLNSSCIPTIVNIDGQYISPYELTVNVRSAIDNVPIEGVNVVVDSDLNVTDSNGEAIFPDFFPLENSTFDVSKVGCTYGLNYNGTIRSVPIAASKSGYTTISISDYLASEPYGEFFQNLVSDYLIRMYPPSTTLVVKVVSSDGVELDVENPNIELSVNGQNQSYLYYDGNYFVQDVSNKVPSTFVLVDNRSSFDVNVTLQYYDEYHQQNVTVYQNGYKTITIYLTASSMQLSCTTAEDCPSTSCNGQYFSELVGCIANRCEYSTSTCLSSSLCDDSKGCFNLQGTDSCIDDTDCVDLSTCLTDYRSRVGTCGSAGLCIYKDYSCATTCNATTGKCSEVDFCTVFGAADRRFLIYSTGQYGGSILDTYVDINYHCNLDHRGERFCISGAEVSATGNPRIITIPDVWQGSSNSTTLTYYDIAAQCDDSCSFNYTYCAYGCNDVTGLCYNEPTSAGGIAKGAIDLILSFILILLPTVPLQIFGYTVFSVLVSAGLTYYVGKNSSMNNGLVFTSSMIAFVLVGIPIGGVPFSLGVIFAILAGYLVMKSWNSNT